MTKYLSVIKPKPNDKIFEIGTGPGYLMWLLKQYECSVSGVDVDYFKGNKIHYYEKIRILLGLNECIEEQKD